MRKFFYIGLLGLLAPLVVQADESRYYRWVDAEGNVHYGDSIPVEYAEYPKQVLNDHGITVDSVAGKKSEEELEAERRADAVRVAQQLQQRADQALLATYLSVEEILMHRDRRVELFQAQSRVTELYLSNLSRRLEALRADASNYQPYSQDSDAPMIPQDLAEDLRQTKDTIERHQSNLKKFRADEQQIITRFAGDISRFKILKGIEDD